MSESWHPRKTEKDVAVARAGVAKYDRGWKYGGLSYVQEHDHSKPGKGGEVLKPEQISNTVYVDQVDGADLGEKLNNAKSKYGLKRNHFIISPGTYDLTTPVDFTDTDAWGFTMSAWGAKINLKTAGTVALDFTGCDVSGLQAPEKATGTNAIRGGRWVGDDTDTPTVGFLFAHSDVDGGKPDRRPQLSMDYMNVQGYFTDAAVAQICLTGFGYKRCGFLNNSSDTSSVTLAVLKNDVLGISSPNSTIGYGEDNNRIDSWRTNIRHYGSGQAVLYLEGPHNETAIHESYMEGTTNVPDIVVLDASNDLVQHIRFVGTRGEGTGTNFFHHIGGNSLSQFHVIGGSNINAGTNIFKSESTATKVSGCSFGTQTTPLSTSSNFDIDTNLRNSLICVTTPVTIDIAGDLVNSVINNLGHDATVNIGGANRGRIIDWSRRYPPELEEIKEVVENPQRTNLGTNGVNEDAGELWVEVPASADYQTRLRKVFLENISPPATIHLTAKMTGDQNYNDEQAGVIDSSINNGIRLHCLNGNERFLFSSGGSHDAVGVTLDMTVYHDYRIEWKTDEVKIYVDGTLEVTYTDTTYIPTVPVHFMMQQKTDSATAPAASAQTVVQDFRYR